MTACINWPACGYPYGHAPPCAEAVYVSPTGSAGHKFESLYYVYDAGHRWGPPDATYHLGWPARRMRPAIPPLVARDSVASKLYDETIADAAVIILNKAHQQGTYNIYVTLEDFEEPMGFLLLLNYGAGFPFPGASHMLQRSAKIRNAFEPTASFWDRLVGQPQESAT